MLTPKLLIIKNDRIKKHTRYELYNVSENRFKAFFFSAHYNSWLVPEVTRWISGYEAGKMGLYHDHNKVYSSQHKPRILIRDKKTAKFLVGILLKISNVIVEVWIGGRLAKKFTLRRK